MGGEGGDERGDVRIRIEIELWLGYSTEVIDGEFMRPESMCPGGKLVEIVSLFPNRTD